MPALVAIIEEILGSLERIAKRTHKNKNTTPAARILRVVRDQLANAADLMYSHASSMVISSAEEAMVAMPMALRR